MPETTIMFERLAVALALGLLIGMERGWKTRDFNAGERIAGVRTFTLIGFLGGLSALLTLDTSPITLGAALLATVAMLALNHWATLQRTGDLGATTMIAALVTFGLGAMAGFGALAVAGAGAVVLALILGVKQELHSFIARLEHRELMAGLELLAISVVLLPVLPDQGFGPFDAINPYEIWWMVVLIAGLSFLGYVAIRVAGSASGVMLTGLVGGFASSTVIAVNMGRLSQHSMDRQKDSLLAAGAIAAVATMFPRVAIIVAAIAPNSAAALAWALIPACLASLGTVALRWRRAASATETTVLQPPKPFELTVALQFTVILTGIMLAVEAARAWFGDSGLYVLAGLAGLFDVDAISLSFARMAANGNLAENIVTICIALGVIANLAVKPILVTLIGAPRMALHMLLPMLTALVAGALGLWLGNVLGLQTVVPGP